MDSPQAAPIPAVILRRVPLFNELSEPELALIAERITTHHYGISEIIFLEGAQCQELFIVRDGSVKIVKTAPSGRNQLLAIERVGSSLSEVPVFDGGRYPATAVTESPTTLLRLDGEHFRAICRQHPDVALKVIAVLAHRLRSMGKLVEELSFATVRGRLAAHLTRLAEETGRSTPFGTEFELSENNEQLAARLGTVRELVSRNLGRLHGEGLIQIRRRAVTVPDLKELRAEALRSVT